MLDSGKTSLEYPSHVSTMPDDFGTDTIDFSDIDFTLNEDHADANSKTLKRKAHSVQCEQTLKKLCALPLTNDQFTQFTKEPSKHFKVTCSMIKRSPCFGHDTNNNIIAQHSSADLFVQSASANTSAFLGYGQEALTGRSFKTMFKSTETSKLDTLVQNVSEQVAAVKPFHAQMISKINDHEDHMEMVVWPVVKKFSKNVFVEFFIQKLDDLQNSIFDSSKNSSSSRPNGCGMDKIITLIDLQGYLISLDSSNFKQTKTDPVTIGDYSITNKSNHGLLNDFSVWHKTTGRKLKLTDYVHSNDLGHLQKHLNDIMDKGEMLTSAIYRLKISDKFAFVQSSSKMIQSESIDEPNKTQHGPYQNSYIQTIHSIIKEIDSDIEMKGKASTSLMKTLISRKPSASSSSSILCTEENSETSNGAIFPMRQKSQSSDIVQPLTPIGTKFALTMLGLSKCQNQKPIKTSSSNSSIRSNEEANDQDRDEQELARIEKNKLKLNLIKKKSIEDNVDTIRHPIDPNSSFKQLIKKEMMALEERKTNTVEANKTNLTKSKNNSKGKEVEPSADTLDKTKANSNNLLLKRLLSQENLVPSDSLTKSNESEPSNDNQLTKKKSIKTESESGSKDDIILRALLNSNDLEPQVLEIESVFKLGQVANNNLNRQQSKKSNKSEQIAKKDVNKNNVKAKNKNININSLLTKENIQLSDDLEKNQLESLRIKYNCYLEEHGQQDTTIQNQNLSKNIIQNPNMPMSKSCTNLTLENKPEPASIKSEPCITNTSKPIQYSTSLHNGHLELENCQNKQQQQQQQADDPQKQKRIEAITKLLKSDLIESFKPTHLLTENNLSTGIDYPFPTGPEFVLNEISNAGQTNYQSNFSSHDSLYTYNVQKSSFYQSHSVHSDLPKESNQSSQTETNSTALRKKLQERLYQKKSIAHASSNTIDQKNTSTAFPKTTQPVNIAVVSPVVSNIETKSTGGDYKSPNQTNMYAKSVNNEYKHQTPTTNSTYKYSLIPNESYSYSTSPNQQQTMTTTVTVTTKHYPSQITSPSYPPPNINPKQDKQPNGYSLSPLSSSSSSATTLPSTYPIYEHNHQGGMYAAPIDRDFYYEPGNYSNYQCDDSTTAPPNIEINTKINLNFQMADGYIQTNNASNSTNNNSKYSYNQNTTSTSPYDNYKKMSSSYPAYDQPIFSEPSLSLSNYQQNQYMRQSYESVCVTRGQPKPAEISYDNVFASNKCEPDGIQNQVHHTNDLSALNPEMCDLQNFEEEAFNENMYFLQNLLID